MSKEKPSQHVALVDGNNVATVPFRRWMDTIDKLADATSTTATAAVAAVAAIPAATPQTLIYPSDTIDVFGAPSSGYTLGVRASALGSSSAAPTFIFMDGDSGDSALIPGPQGGAGLTGAAGTTIAKGAANPGAPALNDLFYRTDLGLLIYYDGTRWLTVNEYGWIAASPMGVTVTSTEISRFPIDSDYNTYLTRLAASTDVATTNTGANYWTINLYGVTAAGAFVLIVAFNTAADTADVWARHPQVINALCNTTYLHLSVLVNKTGAPGVLYSSLNMGYRKIIT